MAEYKDWNVGRKGMPSLQDGDVIDGGNFWQKVQLEIPQNLTIRNSPNMINCKLTGEITSDKPFSNRQVSYCYWANISYDEEGNVINPLQLDVEVETCPHCDPALIEEIETEEGAINDYTAEGCREDRPIGWTL